MAEKYSTAYMYHGFFNHSSVDAHLGCFHALGTVNSAAMNIGVHVQVSNGDLDRENRLWTRGEKRVGKWRGWPGNIHTTICEIDSQWEFAVDSGSLNHLCNNLQRWVGVGGRREGQAKGTYVYLWLIHVDVWQRPIRYCKEAIILQLNINKLKKKS